MQQHKPKEQPEGLSEGEQENRQATGQVAEGQKSLSRKMAVRILVAEEHANNGRQRECVKNPGLLRRSELETGQITVNERQPGTPNEKL